MHGLIRRNHARFHNTTKLFPLGCNRQAEEIPIYLRPEKFLRWPLAAPRQNRRENIPRSLSARANAKLPPRAPSLEQPSPRQTRIILCAPAASSTGIRDHPAAPASNRNPSEAQLFAFDSCSSSTRIVGVSSTARRKRNHASSGTCRTSFAAQYRSDPRRSIQTLRPATVNPSRAASAPHSGSAPTIISAAPLRPLPPNVDRNASPPSISAQASSCAVRALKAESSKLVRPEHDGPKISVSAPRGNPPVNESISGMPLETVTTSWRSR